LLIVIGYLDDATARILTTEEYLTILLKVDFASQEDRMSAWNTREEQDVKVFLAGGDVHQELADRIGITRAQAKVVRHGLRDGTRSTKEESRNFIY